ncbi:MAG: dimethyl sulfoxide reductase anchor subunit [Rhizobiaceae bacterium]|nr:dimethyl sulfoxide reductase anchor subunit [Rhizobiaceae bacterium]
MHPAFSIIVFTTLSGLGYGLASLLGLGLLDPAQPATKVAHAAALALIAGGLVSSTLHLGNPQRAWRALSQWRSSWLSREGVLAVVTFLPLTWSAYLSVFESRWDPVIGVIGTALCAATVFSTSMIYASLKSVDSWHTPWTPASYLGFAAASGMAASAAFGAAGGASLLWPLAGGAAVLVLIAWAIKTGWRKQALRPPLSTPESATGLGHIGKVRQLEPPHMTDNYLTREMGFRVARKHARKLWLIALVMGCGVPAVLLAGLAVFPESAGSTAVLVTLVSVLSLMAGIMVERWLFFAEARHAVMNYYR